MIKAIIFDCFGLFYVDPMKAFVEAQPHHMQTELSDMVRAFDLGVMDEQSLVDSLSKVSGVPSEELHKNVYGVQLVRNQPLLDYAEKLRSNYKVGLLSNLSPHTMDKFFTQEERQQYFDDAVISGDVGLVKPQPEIFMLACKRLGVLPTEAAFIDDTQQNVDAAKACGLQGITYTNLAELVRQLDCVLQDS